MPTPKTKALRGLLITLTLVILILALSLFKSCNTQKYQAHKIQTLEALNDSIKLNKLTDTLIEWKIKTITLTPKEIKAEKLEIKDPQTKQHLEELEKYKNLLAASRIELLKKDTIFIKVKNIKDSTTIRIIDTLSNFTYSGLITIADTILFNLDYRYKLDIRTKTLKEKDNIITYFSVDDPKVDLVGANFIVTPTTQTKKKKAARYLSTILGVSAGFLLGYYIKK